jgi:hypothetical protein
MGSDISYNKPRLVDTKNGAAAKRLKKSARRTTNETCPYRKFNALAVDRESGDAAAQCWICAN